MVASGLSYPGGMLRDESTRGYSFTYNFLSDLGTTVAFNYQRNVTGAALFAVSVVIGVLTLERLRHRAAAVNTGRRAARRR